jgi:hypothetical protein
VIRARVSRMCFVFMLFLVRFGVCGSGWGLVLLGLDWQLDFELIRLKLLK